MEFWSKKTKSFNLKETLLAERKSFALNLRVRECWVKINDLINQRHVTLMSYVATVSSILLWKLPMEHHAPTPSDLHGDQKKKKKLPTL